MVRALTRSCLASISSSGGIFLALLTVAVTASAAHCAAPVTPLSCAAVKHLSQASRLTHTRYGRMLMILSTLGLPG